VASHTTRRASPPAVFMEFFHSKRRLHLFRGVVRSSGTRSKAYIYNTWSPVYTSLEMILPWVRRIRSRQNQ